MHQRPMHAPHSDAAASACEAAAAAVPQVFRAGAFGIFVLGAGGAHTADLGAVCIISTPTRESDMLTNTAND